MNWTLIKSWVSVGNKFITQAPNSLAKKQQPVTRIHHLFIQINFSTQNIWSVEKISESYKPWLLLNVTIDLKDDLAWPKKALSFVNIILYIICLYLVKILLLTVWSLIVKFLPDVKLRIMIYWLIRIFQFGKIYTEERTVKIKLWNSEYAWSVSLRQIDI